MGYELSRNNERFGQFHLNLAAGFEEAVKVLESENTVLTDRFFRYKEVLQYVSNGVSACLRGFDPDKSTLLYPCFGSDILTALSMGPNHIVTIDQRNPLDKVGLPISEVTEYLLERSGGMTKSVHDISSLTFSLDLLLAGIRKEDVTMMDVSEDHKGTGIVQLNYRLPGRTVNHHMIYGVFLEERIGYHQDLKNELDRYNAGLSQVQRPLVLLQKASEYLDTRWMIETTEPQLLVTDKGSFKPHTGKHNVPIPENLRHESLWGYTQDISDISFVLNPLQVITPSSL